MADERTESGVDSAVRRLMSAKGQGIVEYALILVLILVVLIVIGAMIAPMLNVGAHDVTGVVIKTYTETSGGGGNVPVITVGYAVIRQSSGQVSTFSMDMGDYGLVNNGDSCTFMVVAGDVAKRPHCVPANQR